jgi:peptidyl-prolyl cis-trans isomerase C
VAWLGGCSSGSSSGATSSATSQVPAGFAARAGTELISASSVQRIAAAQGLAPAQALDRALSDALFAAAARGSAPLGVASHVERTALARALLEQLESAAIHAGPPTDAEINDLARERWLDVERPDAARTIHAIALVKNPEQAEAARRLAEKLAEAVKPATSATEFERLANSVPLDGLEMKVEALPPVTSDGRTFEQRDGRFVAAGTFEPEFARAAVALKTPGELSPITRSRFGFHVIRLEERVAGHVVPKAELAGLLGPDVLTRRAVRVRRELLEQLRSGVVIEVDRGVDELTTRAKVAP